MRPHYLTLLFLLLAAFFAAQPVALEPGSRILFLGDSITYADKYIQYLDAFLYTRFPGERFELINRGMPSETVAGTSEPTHQPPRPDLHTRFTGTVPPLEADIIIACYGMNDGIYLPPNEEVFAKYRDGIQRLVGRVRAETDAKLILLTPPPFDPIPFLHKPPLEPPDYRRPSSNYDATLAQFAEFLTSFGEKENIQIVDLHTALSDLLQARRTTDSGYSLAHDGIHFNDTGHLLVALEILAAWGVPAELASASIPEGSDSITLQLPLPMPRDTEWDEELIGLANFQPRLNRLRLQMQELSPGNFRVKINGATGPLHTSEELASGIDIGPFFEEMTAEKTRKVLTLVSRRRQVLLEHWVKNDPHPRLAGMHKDSAATPEAAAGLDREIRTLCRPASYTIKVVPDLP